MDFLAQYGDEDEDVPSMLAPTVDLAPAVNTAGLALVNDGGMSIVVPLAATKNLQGAPLMESNDGPLGLLSCQLQVLQRCDCACAGNNVLSSYSVNLA